MKEYTTLELIIKFLFGWLFSPSDTMTILVNGDPVEVENPVCTSDLDERYGKGNWSLKL